MTKQEQIDANAAKGVIYVGSVNENDIWKKKTEQGGWSYIADMGWPDYTPVIWDTTIFTEEYLAIILKDLTA